MQTELDRFFQVQSKDLVPKKIVSDSALCQARKKLKASAFKELNTVQVNHYYKHFETETWNDFRLLAIDGSVVTLPNSSEIKDYFGVHIINERKKDVSFARFSQCFDLLNHMTIDVRLGVYKGKGSGEHGHTMNHFAYMKQGDLVLMDRNYPCFHLFSQFSTKNIEHCSRVKSGSWKLAKQLKDSADNELFGLIYPSKLAKRKCIELGLPTSPIKVRLVKVILESGEIEILITSLLDTIKYPITLFGELYFQRWGIEESYKELKHRLELENFSGKSVLSIYQDIYANIFALNFTNILASDAKEQLKKRKAKHKYKINRTNAISKIKGLMPVLFCEETRYKILKEVLKLFIINPIPIRKSRFYERNFSSHSRRYDMNYKTC